MDAQYEAEYEEIQCIGRGNFGAAYLVKHKTENKDYIAKKILLGSLQQKEQEGALMEVNLLKALNHPNIVSYKTSFISQGLLIIIMEYCEVGDLSFHIKRKLQKNERFTETEIFNWFVQICLALEYIHGRKVLHRDLKSQNIFLTGNNTVKLGDFGISKVLDNTNIPAMTVVGTPYYMSPEICQNQPYTFKSDVWALGCVLYELCTLKHAFSADNLLGLVYKIVQDKYEPIPSIYSQDLSNLINVLLNKNAAERPSVAQILQMPIVRSKMVEFVNTGGQTIQSKKAIYVKNQPIVVTLATDKQKSDEEEAKYAGLNPRQKMLMRREEETKRKMEEHANAARMAALNYQKAQEMRFNEFHASVKGKGQQQQQQLEQTAIHNPQYMQGTVKKFDQTVVHNQQQFEQSQKSDKFDGTEFSANDRSYDSFDLSKSSVTSMAGLTLAETPQQHSPSKYNSPYYGDDRQLTGTGNYDLTLARSEFDIEEDYEESVQAKENKEELKEVVNNYKRILSGIINDVEDVSPKKQEQAVQQQQEVRGQLMGNQKDQARAALGNDLYTKVYEFLKYHRRKQTDEAFMHGEIKKMVGGDRRLLNHCFNLDGIVFMELLQQ